MRYVKMDPGDDAIIMGGKKKIKKIKNLSSARWSRLKYFSLHITRQVRINR